MQKKLKKNTLRATFIYHTFTQHFTLTYSHVRISSTKIALYKIEKYKNNSSNQTFIWTCLLKGHRAGCFNENFNFVFRNYCWSFSCLSVRFVCSHFQSQMIEQTKSTTIVLDIIKTDRRQWRQMFMFWPGHVHKYECCKEKKIISI